MSVPPPPDYLSQPAPAPTRKPSQAAQVLGSLLVAVVLVLVAGGLAVAALNNNAAWCIH